MSMVKRADARKTKVIIPSHYRGDKYSYEIHSKQHEMNFSGTKPG
jgi:hypothetical protein